MARIRVKVENKSNSWAAAMRPRVGASTVHQGFYWTNTTGINSEPGVGNDWTCTGSSIPLLLKWNGYRWYKSAANNNNYPVTGEELQGRGDGRFEGGEWVHVEVVNDDPQDNNDINLFTSYP